MHLTWYGVRAKIKTQHYVLPGHLVKLATSPGLTTSFLPTLLQRISTLANSPPYQRNQVFFLLIPEQ